MYETARLRKLTYTFIYNIDIIQEKNVCSGNIKRRSLTLIARELFVFGKTNVLVFQKRLLAVVRYGVFFYFLFFFCSPRTLIHIREFIFGFVVVGVYTVYITRHGGGGVYNPKNITADYRMLVVHRRRLYVVVHD